MFPASPLAYGGVGAYALMAAIGAIVGIVVAAVGSLATPPTVRSFITNVVLGAVSFNAGFVFCTAFVATSFDDPIVEWAMVMTIAGTAAHEVIRGIRARRPT